MKRLVAVVIVFVMAFVVGAVLVLASESGDTERRITNIGDAIWWSFSAAAAVGYGDFYPVTTWGRVFAGIVTFLGLICVGAISGLVVALRFEPRISSVEEEISQYREWKTAEQQRVVRGVCVSTLKSIGVNQRFNQPGGLETLTVILNSRASELISNGHGRLGAPPWFIELLVSTNNVREVRFQAYREYSVNRYETVAHEVDHREGHSVAVQYRDLCTHSFRTEGRLPEEVDFALPDNHLMSEYDLRTTIDRHGNNVYYIDLDHPSRRHLLGCTCGDARCPARQLPAGGPFGSLRHAP